MCRAGFEPAPPKRAGPKPTALDHSANDTMHRAGFEPAPPKRDGLKPPALDQLRQRCVYADITCIYSVLGDVVISELQLLNDPMVLLYGIGFGVILASDPTTKPPAGFEPATL
jgi:hypothetical protein